MNGATDGSRPASLGHRPVARLAMTPALVPRVFPAAVRERLDAVLDVDWDRVVLDFARDGGTSLPDTEVLITGWGTPYLDDAALALMPSLRAVLHAAGSVKQNLADGVWQRGIVVGSAAGVNAIPVAQFAYAMAVLAGKRMRHAASSYRTGAFPVDVVDARVGNLHKRVGVVGASRVGRMVIDRLAADGFDVVVSDPTLSAADIENLVPGHPVEASDLDGLVRTCDIISLHAPALVSTFHMIGAAELDAMKDGATLINTARGSLVDTGALIRACASGRIGAVLDVTDPEPLPAGHPLFSLENVTITPHIAGSLGTELERFGAFVAQQADALVAGRPVPGQVRLEELAGVA